MKLAVKRTLILGLTGLFSAQAWAMGMVVIPAEPVSSAVLTQADLQSATSFFLPEIQFGAVQAARGRGFGPHSAVDGSGTELTLQASCTVPGDPTDQDGDGIARSSTTTFNCSRAPLFMPPLVGSWTVTDLNDADPQSGYSVSGEETENINVYERSSQTAHAFRFEMNTAAGATYASDFDYRLQFSRAATAEMNGQRRRLNLRVFRKPDADGQGVQLSLSGETSVTDDISLIHLHGAAQLHGELHYSVRCGAAGGIDAGTLTFTSGPLNPATFNPATYNPATFQLPATYNIPTSDRTSTAPTISLTGGGTSSTGVTSSGNGTEVTSEYSLSLNLEYSTGATTIKSSSAPVPALTTLFSQAASQSRAAATTLTYTGCNTFQ